MSTQVLGHVLLAKGEVLELHHDKVSPLTNHVRVSSREPTNFKSFNYQNSKSLYNLPPGATYPPHIHGFLIHDVTADVLLQWTVHLEQQLCFTEQS